MRDGYQNQIYREIQNSVAEVVDLRPPLPRSATAATTSSGWPRPVAEVVDLGRWKRRAG
jgi:hypothetical protein